ncbi:hypothetical protein [Paracoccus sp. (in: a-proteobacteria)]|uniref:hypothetical protein n=1 Tax=Paracoccus sp. TaxID=267 RepID=UPI0035B231FF
MPRSAHDAAELARSLLAELPVAERAELLTELLVQTRDLAALAAARNRLTSEIEDLITQKYEGSE